MINRPINQYPFFFSLLQLINCKQLLVSISSRVYSISKQIIWGQFLHAVSNAAKISNSGARCQITDTDSMLISLSRDLTPWELWQHRIQTGKIPYRCSEIAKELDSEVYRNWHYNLDISSISEDSVLFQSQFSSSKFFSTMFRHLAQYTHKKLMYFQSEVDFKPITDTFSPASKTYLIRSLNLDMATIPNSKPPELVYQEDPSDPSNLFFSVTFKKKCKGTR